MKNRRDFIKTASVGAFAIGLGTRVRGNAADCAPDIAVSLRDAHKGTPQIDLNLLDSYGRPPANLRRFFIEARGIFEEDQYGSFAGNSNLAGSARKHGIELYGGPMLGNLGSEQVWVWVRTVRPAKVSVQTMTGTGETKTFGPAKSTVESDLTAVVKLQGLEPDTEYRYNLLLDGQDLPLDRPLRFKTLPAPGSGICRLAFGSCFHKAGLHNPHLLSRICERGNRAMILLGDLAVDDRNDKIGLHRSDYLLRDLSPAWRDFAAQTPLYAAWDDHDYFDNDLAGIPKKFRAKDVAAVREVWTRNWNNPAYGDGGEGIYFHTRIGPADLIMLDTRSQRRRRPRMKNAYLGERQTEWLKRELLKCKGPFTIISSGTMWSDNISNGKDSWGVWDPEGREDLFRFIEKQRVPGVLLLSGDRHGARGIKIERPAGHCFYEFEPACLGGMTGPPAWGKDRDSQLFGYKHLRAFGEFTFDTSSAEPCVTFRLVDATGQVLENITLRQSEIGA